eukprot:2655761-Prymnesium_polylepis.1
MRTHLRRAQAAPHTSPMTADTEPVSRSSSIAKCGERVVGVQTSAHPLGVCVLIIPYRSHPRSNVLILDTDYAHLRIAQFGQRCGPVHREARSGQECGQVRSVRIGDNEGDERHTQAQHSHRRCNPLKVVDLLENCSRMVTQLEDLHGPG